MNDNILEIKDLHVIYDTDENLVYAINGLDLSVRRGETLGLVGETGAGKTTTAMSILDLLPENVGKITQGSIVFDGKEILKLSEDQKRTIRGNDISMIFQDPMTSLNPVFTVGQLMSEVISTHNPDLSKQDVENRVDDLFKLVGLPPERKTEYAHQFSGGMKQRIVIAMALSCEPQLLLADEPTTALDVTIQAQVLDLMQSLKQKLNTSMILITHDLGIVAEICDRVAIMYAGRIIEQGSLSEIYEGKEHHLYTLGLFGAIPDIHSKSKRLNPIPGLMPDPTNLPKGCSFAERCPFATDYCRENAPSDKWVSEEHMISCHYPQSSLDGIDNNKQQEVI